MIKNSLKNLGKNLVFIFVPMGIVYLFMLIAVFVFAGAAAGDIGATFSELSELLDKSLADSSEAIGDFFAYAMSQIDWNGNFGDTLQTLIDTNWLQNTFKGFVDTLSQSTEGFEQNVSDICARFAENMVADAAVAIALCVLGTLLANFATKFVLRSKLAKRSVKQFVIAHTLAPLAQTLLLVVSLALLATIRLYSLLVYAVFAVLMCILSLLSSYLIYRGNGLSLKQVMTAKNVLQHLASICIILLINFAVAVALCFINKLLAAILMIPILIYSANIIDVNSDSYVRAMAEAIPES